MSISPVASRVQRVRHEIKRRELVLARVHAIGPNFRRLTFTGDDLADFVSASFDDHLKVLLDAGGPEPLRRDFTPRRFDAAARELDIEFAVQHSGPAAQWAAQAQVGQALTVAGPRGSFIVPTDFAWHLLVGDESALPAIHRRLEELPAGTRALVVVQLKDPGDRRALGSAAALDLHWTADAAQTQATVRALALPPGEGYAWAAGEASEMAALRRVLVEEKGIDRHAMRVAAYWKRGAAAHHESLED